MVRSFLKNGKDLIFQEQKTILSAAFIIAGMILASSLLGLIKMRLYAGILGASLEFDTFVAAFKIPDFLFQLLVVGSLNAAFIPIFSEIISLNDGKTAWRFASNIINISLIFFALFALIIFLFTDKLTVLVAAGLPADHNRQLIDLMRIMMVSPLILGISNFVSGSLQSFRRFFIPFLAPIFYNLGAILGILFLYLPFGLSGLAWGVVLGSFLHLIIQLPLLLHLGFSYHPSFSLKDQHTRRMLTLSLPRSLGLAAEQLKSIILVNLASLLGGGAISVMRFGESIATVPVALVGVAISQASLPTLSRLAREDKNKLKETFLSSFHEILYLSLPISVILIVLKVPVVRLIFGVGHFNWPATVNTAWILAILAGSLFAQSLTHLLIRTFYALQNTKTPLVISLFSVVISLLTGILLMGRLSIFGLMVGISVGAIAELILLLYFLNKDLAIEKRRVIVPSLKIIISSLIMAFTIYLPVKILDSVFLDTTRTVNLIILVWLVLTLGLSTYLFLTWLMGCSEIRIFFKILWRLKNLRENIAALVRIPIPVP